MARNMKVIIKKVENMARVIHIFNFSVIQDIQQFIFIKKLNYKGTYVWNDGSKYEVKKINIFFIL